MSVWLLSIIGVVFLGVMLDILYPNGKTVTICKSVFGIIVVIILFNPIFEIKNINLDKVVCVTPDIVSSINKSKAEALKITLVNKLIEKNIIGVDVEIDVNLYNTDFQIENIYIDIVNLVLTENITNINKYEVITNEICDTLEIDKERIFFYG